jgi:hypothetical protein
MGLSPKHGKSVPDLEATINRYPGSKIIAWFSSLAV